MKLRFTHTLRLFLVLALVVTLLPDLKAAETAGQPAPGTPGAKTMAPPAQEATPPCGRRTPQTVQPATGETAPETAGSSSDEAADIQVMKQRYGQDPTGVRARLGMCRGRQGMHGGGPHRRFRGGDRWNAPQ